MNLKTENFSIQNQEPGCNECICLGFCLATLPVHEIYRLPEPANIEDYIEGTSFYEDINPELVLNVYLKFLALFFQENPSMELQELINSILGEYNYIELRRSINYDINVNKGYSNRELNDSDEYHQQKIDDESCIANQKIHSIFDPMTIRFRE
jgi:hypothetical protein